MAFMSENVILQFHQVLKPELLQRADGDLALAVQLRSSRRRPSVRAISTCSATRILATSRPRYCGCVSTEMRPMWRFHPPKTLVQCCFADDFLPVQHQQRQVPLESARRHHSLNISRSKNRLLDEQPPPPAPPEKICQAGFIPFAQRDAQRFRAVAQLQ